VRDELLLSLSRPSVLDYDSILIKLWSCRKKWA
jgi:hypothetical protein